MALTIDAADRISNKTPPISSSDMTELNATHVMTMLDNIVNGVYRLKVKSWTALERPASPETGEIGFNTELSQFEGWNGTEWVILG